MDPYIKNANGTLVPMSIPVIDDSLELDNNEMVTNSFVENTEGVFIQPKVIGVECNAYKTHLQTTDGIEITAPHIMEEIEILFSFFSNSNVHIFFNGHIYKHDTSIDKIKLLLSSQDESLQFVITDLGITDYTFEQRYRILTTLMENIPVLQHIVLCTTCFVQDVAELKKAHLLNTELGFESSIVKPADSLYKPGEISSDCFEIKTINNTEDTSENTPCKAVDSPVLNDNTSNG